MSGNLSLGSNHDIVIGRGAARIEGAPQVAQLCKCNILTLLGEWKLDQTLGLPWFDALLSKQVRPADIQAALANIVRATSGVRELIDLQVDADYRTRKVTVTFTAISIYGDISDFITWQQYNTA